MKLLQRIERIIAGLLALLLLLYLLPAAPVSAAATMSIKVYSGNTEVGSTINVLVIANGDGPYQNYDGSLSYDHSILQLTSLVQGDYSKASFKASGDNFTDFNANISNGGVLVYASFKCLATGSTDLSCSLGALADMNGNSVTVSGASTTVTVTTPVPKSTNADLASLAVSPGTLSPEFSAAQQSYTVSVAANQNKITVSAAPADGKSKVSLNGVQDKLVPGSNTVKITVTAENGSTRVYTVTVTKESGPTPTPAPTPVPLPLMQYNGIDYTILKPGASDSIPEGFASATVKYKDVNIPALQKTMGEAADASVMTVVLLTADARTSYFIYDAVSQTCYPYVKIASAVLNLQILDKSEAVSVPNGYEAFSFSYLENTVTGYRLISDTTNPQVLLYLMDDRGVSAFYYYDTLNSQLMLYRGAVTIEVPTPTPTITTIATASPVPTNVPVITGAVIPAAEAGSTSLAVPSALTFRSLLDYKNPVVMIIYLLALFCLVMLGICIVLIARKGRPYMTDEEQDEPENDQQSNAAASDTPFVAAKPKVFFNEFGQGQEDNELYFGDKPPQAEVKLDFPDISRSTQPAQPVYHTAETQDIENTDINGLNPATNTSSLAVKSDKQTAHDNSGQYVQPGQYVQSGQYVQPGQYVQSGYPIEHIPVRLQKALDAEQAKSSTDAGPVRLPDSRDNSNDPDFDPDDQ